MGEIMTTEKTKLFELSEETAIVSGVSTIELCDNCGYELHNKGSCPRCGLCIDCCF